jgi:sugar lactone lactonase YvrE
MLRTRCCVVLGLVVASLGACGDGDPSSPKDPVQAQSPKPENQAMTGRRLAVGEMATIAGGGEELGDGGPARSAAFCETYDIAIDEAGNLYVTDPGLFCDGPGGGSVRRIDPNGVISTFAGGSGVVGFGGDGGPATKALFDVPGTVAVDDDGNVYITDQDNFRIRRVDTEGTITTVAGTGEQGYSGDGGPATKAQFTVPAGMAFDAEGNLYVADFAAVRRIAANGTISTVAGTGRWHRAPDPEHLVIGPRTRFRGEGGPATEAMLIADEVALDEAGRLYIADTAGNRVYRVSTNGTIKTVAGTVSGKGRRLGDGGPATKAFIDGPVAVEVDQSGNLLIADHHGERIRKVDRDGTIKTIAGTGEKGFSGEYGTATEMMLDDPAGLALGPPGILYIADLFNARIRALRYQPS